MGLREKAFDSVRWTALSTLVRFGLNLVQVAVLARILSPEDFGLQALAMSAIVLAQIVSEFGISNAIMFHQELSQRVLSSLYWVNITIGLMVSAMIAIASPYVANFYGKPELRDLLLLLSLTFIIQASAQQLRVISEKNLRFRYIAIVDIVSVSAGFLIAVCLGFIGFGVYSLTLGYLANISVFSLMSWIILSQGWRPQFLFSIGDIKKFLRFGCVMLGVGLLNSLGAQADVIVIGRYFPSSQIGMYFQPRELTMKLSMMINPIITRVSLPVVAAKQGELDSIGRIYAHTTLVTASVNFPIFAFIALYAQEIVIMYLGSKWGGSEVYLRGAALWAFVRCIGNPIGSLLIGTGRIQHALLSSMLVTSCVFGVSLATVMFFNLEYLAYALALFYLVLIIPFWAFNVRPASGLSFRSYHAQLVKPAIATGVACLVSWFGNLVVLDPLLRLLFGGLIGAAVYLAMTYWINREAANSILQLLTVRHDKTSR